MSRLRPIVVLLCVASAILSNAVVVARTPVRGWIATWATSPQAGEADPDEPLAHLSGQTVRERFRIGVAGRQIRIRLSNEFGRSPLVVGAASVALARDAASVESGSLRRLTFGGRSSVRIPVGAPVLSDPVDLAVSAGQQLSISLFFAERVATPTLHSVALKQAVVSGPGDHTQALRIDPVAGTSTSSIAVTAILVPQKHSGRLVVAFGDSLTDGVGSTTDADRSWPSQLAQRLAKSGSDIAVVNAGIAGNQLSHEGFGESGLARFDRDALSLPGVTHIVLFEGINDLAAPGAKIGARYFAPRDEVRTAEQIVAGYQQLIARAHDHGITVIGATLTPFADTTVPGYYSIEKEAVRQAVNAWIRKSGAFDAIIDFDAVLRDSANPSQLQSRFASRDRLHPNDLGYRAMAEAVDTRAFR